MPDQLKELQRLFAEAVLVTGPYAVDESHWPIGERLYGARGCWFKDNIPGIDPCGGGRPGVLEAAHWIKRQQVERWVHLQLPADGTLITEPQTLIWKPGMDISPIGPRYWEFHGREEHRALAAWDPRNAVPACEHHHRRFDGHHVPLPREQLIVPRLLVPAHVLEFSEDYGMETFIEDKHPLEV